MSERDVYELRVRRAAKRQGFALSKSRLRDPRAIGYGEIWLELLAAANPEQSNDAHVGPFADFGEVESWLSLDPETRPHKRDEIEEWRMHR